MVSVRRHSGSFVGSGQLGVCLVEDTLQDLLLVLVEDLGQVLIKLGLLLLKVCGTELAVYISHFERHHILMKTCLNRLYGSILSRGVSRRLSSSISSSSSSANDPNFCAYSISLDPLGAIGVEILTSLSKNSR